MKADKTLYVLCFFTAFFTVVALGVAYFRPQDGQLWTGFFGLLGNFAGGLLTYLNVVRTTSPPAGSTTVTQVEQVTKTPPEKTE